MATLTNREIQLLNDAQQLFSNIILSNNYISRNYLQEYEHAIENIAYDLSDYTVTFKLNRLTVIITIVPGIQYQYMVVDTDERLMLQAGSGVI